LDTLVVNTLMALLVLASGAWKIGETAPHTYVAAWDFPGGASVSAIILALFVFTTLVSWGFYGEEAAGYLFGDGIRWPYRITYIVFALVGALGGFEVLTAFADTLNGMMAIPNLIGLLILGGLVAKLVQGFFRGEPWHPPR